MTRPMVHGKRDVPVFWSPPILVGLAALTFAVIAANPHASWAVVPWLMGLVLGAAYFRPQRVGAFPSNHESTGYAWAPLLGVLVVAGAARGYGLGEFPLGPYIDEVFNLKHSLSLLERPFDLFGHTPLIEGVVDRANLYGYMNLLILKPFGIIAWSIRLPSVIAGLATCGVVYLAGRLMFDRTVALATALLFALGHWPIRLSRCSWDVAFAVMGFSVALWLLASAIRRGRPLHAYGSGIVMGLSLFSYLAAWICLTSLCAFLLLEVALRRDRSIKRHAVAFVAGVAAAVFPFLCRYGIDPMSPPARVAGLSVFGAPHPLPVIAENIWRHALMFHVSGGSYARDNYPGLPMMDPLTGLAFIAGLVILARSLSRPLSRLLGCAFVFTLAGGVFSISQEGPPYVLRTAPVMVPAFLIAGMGIQRLMERSLRARGVAWSAITGALLLNLYLYFGLETRNVAAMRVMAYEPRLIGLEIARDDMPVLIIGRDSSTEPPEVSVKPGEACPDSNPAMMLGPALRRLAVIYLSGRYDPARSASENFQRPRGIHFVSSAIVETDDSAISGPTKVIFQSRDRNLDEAIRRGYPRASFRYIRDILGEPRLTVAIL